MTIDLNKDIIGTFNNGKLHKHSPYKWLYYVYLPSIRRWKVGVAKSIPSRMNSLGLKSLEGRDRVYEGKDYIILFKRRYLSNTAYKYERAIHAQSKDSRVPSYEKPLISGNTELYWLDIGDTFIPYIPESDIPIKEPKKITYKDGASKDKSYKGLGYYFYPKTNEYHVRMKGLDGKKKLIGKYNLESNAITKVNSLIAEGWTV